MKKIVLAILVGAAAVLLTGCAERSPQPVYIVGSPSASTVVQSVTMPDVIGSHGDIAVSHLHEAGFTNVFYTPGTACDPQGHYGACDPNHPPTSCDITGDLGGVGSTTYVRPRAVKVTISSGRTVANIGQVYNSDVIVEISCM